MSDREQEAIERIAKALGEGPPYEYAPAALAALTEPRPCPTCGGTDEQLADGTYSENGCPDCTDGTVPPLLRWNDA